MLLKTNSFFSPISVIPFIATVSLLLFIEWKVKMPMLLLERFLPGWGWIEVIILGLYASFLFTKLSDQMQSVKWRKISWTIFAVFFFAQLSAGLLGCEPCLMTGNLHFPIPAMIIGGSVYRMEFGFMPILFLSTIILSGPAWCSQLCYFGAFDNLAAYSKKIGRKKIVNRNKVKNSFFVLFLAGAVLLRVFNVPIIYAIVGASLVGITGVLIIIFVSPKKGKMIHCIAYCPVGTIIQYLKYVNPFRLQIQQSCTECMVCTTKCPYDALNREDILKRKPGKTCTYCGDCLSSCHGNFIEYKFLNLSPNKSRLLWLIVTVTIHAVFMGLARI
jgi:ferredoxin